jgi:hypothetical protein
MLTMMMMLMSLDCKKMNETTDGEKEEKVS